MGSDTASQDTGRARQDFNPRSPDGERRAPPRRHSRTGGYFNPRSPDGERLAIWSRIDCNTDISIHAPRMGSDQRRIQRLTPAEPISIHAPRMGSDEASAETCAWYKPFQSTLPGWGATICSSQPLISLNDFNPRSPDGERPPLRHAGTNVRGISIHAPRMGSDLDVCTTYLHRYKFQSTLPGWGATIANDFPTLETNFNPRSPDGERQGAQDGANWIDAFQSTLPGWGATVAFDLGEVLAVFISIHAPRMGSDNDNNVLTPDFKISIHAPRMGSDKARARNSRRH